jgi:hypothetical protein
VPRVRYQKRVKAGPAVAGIATPVNTVLPVITGDTAGETSTTSDGTWTSADAFTYQWYLDGVLLAGETTNSIDTDEGWVGQTLTVVVCGGGGGGMTCVAAVGVVLQEAPSYTGPLDLVPGAVVAYGQRAMAAAWTSNAITIREDAGDTTQSFPTNTNNAINPAAVTTFLSGADGFGTTVKDQSGNARDAVQVGTDWDDPAFQPLWVASAVNSKPSFSFTSGSHQFLATAANFASANTAWSGLIVAKVSGNGGYIVGINGAGDYSGGEMAIRASVNVDDVGFVMQADDFGGNGFSYGPSSLLTGLNGQYFVMAFAINSSGATLLINGVSVPLDQSINGTGNAGAVDAPIGIGVDDPIDQVTFTGEILEASLWTSALTGGQLVSLSTNAMTYYGIS